MGEPHPLLGLGLGGGCKAYVGSGERRKAVKRNMPGVRRKGANEAKLRVQSAGLIR